MSVPRACAVLMRAGCGSSSSASRPGYGRSSTPTSTPTAAATPTPSAKEDYAKAQSFAPGRVDKDSGEVTYLNPAQTGPAVLGQKVHTLTKTIRASAKSVAGLDGPPGAAALQRREVAQLRAYAKTLDAWVKSHPKRTVSTANDIIKSARRKLDRTIDALAKTGLA